MFANFKEYLRIQIILVGHAILNRLFINRNLEFA